MVLIFRGEVNLSHVNCVGYYQHAKHANARACLRGNYICAV